MHEIPDLKTFFDFSSPFQDFLRLPKSFIKLHLIHQLNTAYKILFYYDSAEKIYNYDDSLDMEIKIYRK